MLNFIISFFVDNLDFTKVLRCSHKTAKKEKMQIETLNLQSYLKQLMVFSRKSHSIQYNISKDPAPIFLSEKKKK